MDSLFSAVNLTMFGIILFSSLFIFLFIYRHDNKDKYQGRWPLIIFDLVINMGMSITGYILIWLVFENVPQLTPFNTYKFPIGYLFGLTSNISIPIVLKWFTQQITKKLNEVSKGGK